MIPKKNKTLGNTATRVFLKYYPKHHLGAKKNLIKGVRANQEGGLRRQPLLGKILDTICI